jgi:ABC-type multidrug transport system ATPase subunit
MRSGHAAAAMTPVLAAGVGVKEAGRYPIRLASFRLPATELSRAALGIVTPRCTASTLLVRLLSGQLPPAYGQLLVLDEDLTTAAGRAKVRSRVGIASRGGYLWPTLTIRGLVERAARGHGHRQFRSGRLSPDDRQSRNDRQLLAAAILDRLALLPWSAVPVRDAPEIVARRARLAAACVHQPELLIIDGLFDQLPIIDRTILANTVADLKRDTSIVATGQDADALLMFCDQVLILTNGIVVGRRSLPATAMHELIERPPFDHAR